MLTVQVVRRLGISDPWKGVRVLVAWLRARRRGSDALIDSLPPMSGAWLREHDRTAGRDQM